VKEAAKVFVGFGVLRGGVWLEIKNPRRGKRLGDFGYLKTDLSLYFDS
jgi:hypothetical protein